MKKLILIFALFMFTITIESSTIEDGSSEQGEKILILHNTGNGFIEIEISIEALQYHLAHGDTTCLPPCRP